MQDKVYEAAEIIKGYCAKVTTCGKCELVNEYGVCLFNNGLPPCDWDVEKWKPEAEAET